MPSNKNVFLGHSTAMIAIEDGMNEHGLAAGLTFLLPTNLKPGLNGGFMVRLILEECRTTAEAIELIKRVPHSSNNNFILADRSGNLAVVEASSDRIKVRRDDRFVIATNHFLSEDMVSYNCTESNWYLTNTRYETILDTLTKKDMSLAKAKDLLSGKYGMVCQYERSLHFETIWSSVYALNSLSVETAEGSPNRVQYKTDNRLTWGINKNQ